MFTIPHGEGNASEIMGRFWVSVCRFEKMGKMVLMWRIGARGRREGRVATGKEEEWSEQEEGGGFGEGGGSW